MLLIIFMKYSGEQVIFLKNLVLDLNRLLVSRSLKQIFVKSHHVRAHQMRTMQLRYASLVFIFALAGCGTTPEQWQGMLQQANEMNAGQRNYLTNPITPPAPLPSTQPNFKPFGSTSENEYKTIMVNTPNGYVYKRCKMLNGQVVTCL